MRILCPQCGYSRDIPEDKIPARSSIATCPKCQLRFRFRGRLELAQEELAINEPAYPPNPSRTPAGAAARLIQEGEAFEPSQRLYHPPDESLYAVSAQPRPQARWLPDPEPDAPPQRPLSMRPGPARPAAAEAFSAPGQQRLSPQHPPAGLYGAPYDPERPNTDHNGHIAPPHTPDASGAAPSRREAPAAPDEYARPDSGYSPAAEGEGDPTQKELLARPPYAAPEDFPDPDVGRLGDLSQEHAAGADQHMPGGGTQADYGVQPSEAITGDESVRDIWARLQAMGGEEQPRPGAPRQANAAQSAQPHRPASDTLAPWEELELYGVVPAFLATSRNIIAKPGDFFEQLPPYAGKVRPLLFAVVVCLVAVLSGILWNFFGLGPNFAELSRTEYFQGLGAGALGRLAWLGLSPLVVMAFVFISSALSHLLLGLLRSASRPFEETFRTICYAGGPWLLSALPVPYSYLIPVILIWHMTLESIGLKKLHGVGYPQVLASVLVKWSLIFMASFAVLHMLITRS